MQRPTPAELRAAHGAKVPDVVAPGLLVLFCGINPGLYSGATGHHFARPGNRFYGALHASGFTERRLQPDDEDELLAAGVGITNLVNRATASAREVTAAELRAGAGRLRTEVRRLGPRSLAFLGLGAYRSAFGRPRAQVGRQPDVIGDALVWLLPNPSGLNAHWRPADFARAFAQLRAEVVGRAAGT